MLCLILFYYMNNYYRFLVILMFDLNENFMDYGDFDREFWFNVIGF